jgi:hypothetical protein
MMGALFIVMSLINHARNGPIRARDVAAAVVSGVSATVVVSVLQRRIARKQLERDESETTSPAHTLGRRIGEWFASINRRG